MALLYLQNRDSKVVNSGDYVRYAPSSTRGFLYAPLGAVDIIGNATEKIYPGKWGYINPLNNWDGLIGAPEEALRVDQTVTPQDTFGLFTFPSVWHTEERLPTSGSGVWVGLVLMPTVPAFVSASVENATPTKVVLTYDIDLDEASVPATGDFTVTDHTVSSVAVSGATVELTLSTAVIYFDILYVTYTKGANPIQGAVGGLNAEDLSSTLITNNVAVTGNEVGWWLASDESTITKDGSNLVSVWADKLASGRDLVQATGTKQPIWSASGITFDGVDDFMRVPFTWVEPWCVVMVFEALGFADENRIFTSAIANFPYLKQEYLETWLRLGWLTAITNTNFVTEQKNIVICICDGLSSELRIGEVSQTGSIGAGSTVMDGICVGCQNMLSRFSNIRIQEIIGFDVAISADYKTSLYNVLKRRYGL